MSETRLLREQLVRFLDWEESHVGFDNAVAGVPADKRGARPAGFEHSAWQLLEHLRIAQWDILEFSRDPKHVSPKWPEGYWPPQDQLGTGELWQGTAEKFRNDLKQMENLVADPSTDLLARIPHGTGQTILREALLVADHNSYHLGALVVMSAMGWFMNEAWSRYGGVVLSGAESELLSLAESLGAPVATTISGKGSIPDGHPLCVGLVGRYSRFANDLLAVLTACAVVAAMRVVGILLVAAMMVLPVASAQAIGRSFGGVMRWAVAIGVFAAMMSPATPSGCRTTAACLLGMALVVVRPYQRRPSPATPPTVGSSWC